MEGLERGGAEESEHLQGFPELPKGLGCSRGMEAQFLLLGRTRDSPGQVLDLHGCDVCDTRAGLDSLREPGLVENVPAHGGGGI